MSGSDFGAHFSPSHSASLHLKSNGSHRHVEERKRPLSVPILATHTQTHPARLCRSITHSLQRLIQHVSAGPWDCILHYPPPPPLLLLLLHLVASLGPALELPFAERRQQAATLLVGSSSGWQRHAAEAHGCAEIRNGLWVLAVSRRFMLDDCEQEGQARRYRKKKAGF